MKKLISIQLSLILLLSSLIIRAPEGFTETLPEEFTSISSEEGIIKKLEKVGKLYRDQCLPPSIKTGDIEKYHLEHGLTEECWKYITEIRSLEAELQKRKLIFEEQTDCSTCDTNNIPKILDPKLTSKLKAITIDDEELSCSEEKKIELKKQCPSDLSCVLEATAKGLGGPLAQMLFPKTAKPKNCNLNDDNCLTQLASGFLNSTITFFKLSWDLLKSAKVKAGEKMSEFWNWVSGAEDHSSTAQLAMAKASEDPGVFDMLRNDFSGTISKIWSAFAGAISEWMKQDIFCQKWSGTPHFSQCLEPSENFECTSCKAMVSGLCTVSGYIVAEVVPAFLTGGLIESAKTGANAAGKISKLFKISEKGLMAIKASTLGKIASKGASKVEEVLKITKVLTATKVIATGALKAINTYMLSPSRNILKASLEAINNLAKNKNVYLVVSASGKTLSFAGKAISKTAKVVFYPINNPMNDFAFKAGKRSFENLIKIGAPQLATKGAVALNLIIKNKSFESILAKIEAAKIEGNLSPEELLKLELNLFKEVSPIRKDILSLALKDKTVDLEEIINNLYPELQYGPLARTLPSKQILSAEKELYLELEKLADGELKTKLLNKYVDHLAQGEARTKVVGNASPTYAQVLENSNLSKEDRFDEAIKLIQSKPKSPAEIEKLKKTLEKAHLSAPENGVYEYSWIELREKHKILVTGGFTEQDADALIRWGLAGRPPVRKLITPGATLFSGFAEDIVDGKYLDKRKELFKFLEQLTPEKKLSFTERIKAYLGANAIKSNQIIDNIESFYFVDYAHLAEELEVISKGGSKIDNILMSARYDQNAFDNFKNARSFLLTKKPEINKNTLFEVHRKMMEGGIDNIASDEIGVIRDISIVGRVQENPISLAIKNNIIENPYLRWVEEDVVNNGQSFRGKIYYPNANDITKQGLDLIREKHPDLVLQIEKHQALPHSLQVNSKLYTEKLVTAMVDDLMDWFTRESTLIGDINTPEKLDQYSNLVAKFQRNLVSIHPLRDGNGRTTRELALSYAFMKKGLPPPRLIDPNADIYSSLEDWQKIVKQGVLASDYLVDDLTERLKFGLPMENSLEFITPYNPSSTKMTLKGQKGVLLMDGVEYVDPRLYREIIKREIASQPQFSKELQKSPLSAWDKIDKKAKEIFSKNNLYYNHPKNGIERVELGYVDEDFKILFGKSSFDNKSLFDFKMKTWYSDELSWRGLASKTSVKSEEEIISMFQNLNHHMASNAVVGKIGNSSNQELIRKAVLEDFEKYNNDVFNDGLVQMARDHSETGPMYGISYGYSTSKNRVVGKAFAMGAMVIAEYGAQNEPELQALLKSRVLVGARRATKDVDLGRLKQVREEFSYKYGRQQEVMGIGASDPDAISIVQTINAEGGVTKTYLRNKNLPDQIWVIKGDIDPDLIPAKIQIEKIITLKR